MSTHERRMHANRYSPEWFSVFLDGVPPEQTAREVDFVDRQLERGSRVLDLPCGAGRHARLLAGRGHRVVAVDRHHPLLRAVPGPPVGRVCADMRALPLAPGRFDAVVCLWQSFGYFGAAENAALLRGWSALVRPGGRLVLDLYHRDHFAARQGERRLEHRGHRVRERRHLLGDRLVVEIAYEDLGGGDRFEWQLFTPEEMSRLASACGWEPDLACTGFDPARPPDPEQPRVQYVLRRPG